MKKFIGLFILFFSYQFIACQNQVAIDDIKNAPKYSAADTLYADVYKILDGTWKGQFLIYKDQKRKTKSGIELKDLSAGIFKNKNFKLINKIDVTQVYKSESPYFQRVTITDFYPETGKKEISIGVNKIQDGKMWCVVRKPGERVIHKGSTEGEHTIIWQRNESSPQRIEYFKETVGDDYYEIIGWGYYEGDDVKLSPPLWFYAKYERERLNKN
ncbi:MAG TPA: hypothetical protein ENJ95_22750 [Bacteroidetes bacterium]|nr:hypothetical protein [Bacteroidota bacterium]